MFLLLHVFVLAAEPASATEQYQAETVYAIDFEEATDVNYDQWPDTWTRRRGIGFPQYVIFQIAEDAEPRPSPSRCLRIDQDGGGAAAFSPPIDISPRCSYVFDGYVKTEDLKLNVAYFTITFYNTERTRKECHTSEAYRGTSTWQHVRLGPIAPTSPDVTVAVIGVHSVPTTGSDLRGAAMFDDLRLARLPRVEVATSSKHGLYFDRRDVVVTCDVSGLEQQCSGVSFELLDVAGNTVAAHQTLLGEESGQADSRVAEPSGTETGVSGDKEIAEGRSKSTTWRPPIPDQGFYRVRVSIRGGSDLALQRTVSLAILEEFPAGRDGEFGWSIPFGEDPLAMNELAELLAKAGVARVKYPVWHGPLDDEALQRVGTFADQLNASGIDVVAVLGQPPAPARLVFGNHEVSTVAGLFVGPELWRPEMEPLFARLSLKVRDWQLGGDGDHSLVDVPDLESKVRDVQSHLKQYGQRTRLGLAWPWMVEVPATPDTPWRFLAMTETPPFNHVELAEHVSEPLIGGAKRWVTLQPLPDAEYDLKTRVSDLVLRMVAAKVSHAEAIFIADPFDRSSGLFHRDGTPRDTFLPWRVAAEMMGGAEFLGSMALPHGSRNYLFHRDGSAVLVVWNSTPVTESVYLGEGVRQIDLWGRVCGPLNADRQAGEEQQFAVDQLPTFLTGLSLPLAQWRLQCAFDPNELAGVSAGPEVTVFRFRNTFPTSASGTVSMDPPPAWDVPSPETRFKLGTNEELRWDLPVMFHSDVSCGPQNVRIDFDVTADRRYRFSVLCDVRVGPKDIAIELKSWLDETGQLVVEQNLVNGTQEPLSFNCLLFAPGRRRVRQQVLDAGPGRNTRIFTLPNGEELIGTELWLRAEQLGGGRLLNQRVTAEP